nr:alpha/beta hydrolase [Nesterenkonia sp. Act20]
MPDDDGARLSTSAAVWRYSPAPRADSQAQDAAPRLLFIHGFRGDHHGMALIVDALPEYEIFVPDLPGFGETAPLKREQGEPGEHDLDAYAAFVEALADELSLGPHDVLVGHSFGSIIVAAHVAHRERGGKLQRWAGLGLFAPISNDIFAGRLLPGAAGVDAYYRLARALPARAAQLVLHSPLALAVTNASMIVSRDPALIGYIRDQHRRYFSSYSDPRTLLQAYWASSRHTVTEFAADLHLPVLLAPGSQDQLSTPAGQRGLRRALPHGELEVLHGTGHLLHYEKPAQAARALRRFLLSLDQPDAREEHGRLG